MQTTLVSRRAMRITLPSIAKRGLLLSRGREDFSDFESSAPAQVHARGRLQTTSAAGAALGLCS